MTLVGKKKDVFLTAEYTNWKEADGEKKDGFSTHERSEVHVGAIFIMYLWGIFLLTHFHLSSTVL